MNGLTLRINPSGSKKMKNSIGFAPITIPIFQNIEYKNELCKEFIEASSADEQLGIIKKILDVAKGSYNEDVMMFLAVVFLQAEAKHPVKCFITRQITKTDTLHQVFSEKLAHNIQLLITKKYVNYNSYITVVSRVATCIENFPAGAAAVKALEVELTVFLKLCLDCCVRTLSDVKTLSPTEKNEIFSLSHLALRLLLYIVQKVNEEKVSKLIPMFKLIRMLIKELIFNEDAPMDTKSICGILFLSIEIVENGTEAWVKILDSNEFDESITSLLQDESAQLALYSGLATVVSAERLQAQKVGDRRAIECLTEKMIAIGERSFSESTFVLGVTRTLHQISKMLAKVSDNTLGLRLVDQLLVFVWGHLEHYMDSVRHLTAQALANIAKYCTYLERKGDSTGLDRIFSALSCLDKSRKSYYVGLSCVSNQLGARVCSRLPTLIPDLIHALSTQAVQASATTTLETLLQKHAQESNAETIYKQWIVAIMGHVSANSLETGVLNILDSLMTKAVALDDNVINYILPHIDESCNEIQTDPGNLKCVLMLLKVARHGAAGGEGGGEEGEDTWKGIVSYDVLKMAAIDAVEETRILSLSLVCESSKSTEVFARGDLKFVRYFLRYNINAQSPNFRQLTLSLLKKFIKRIEDSYKVLLRQKDVNDYNDKGYYYLSFMEELRGQCFDSLIPGANYSRRYVALQVLAWCEGITLKGYNSVWKEDYVDKLLLHLEDSYENNKALALQVLDACPRSLLQGKKYHISLDFADILRQASSMKPTDCVSAAYKINFLKRKLPEHLLGEKSYSVPEPEWYSVLVRLVSLLQSSLVVCSRAVTAAARDAPMYGLLHVAGHVCLQVDPGAISDSEEWRRLIAELIETCYSVNDSVASVVNNASPEGHLPMDATDATQHQHSSEVKLEDGRPVTAQMVLLCAWRCVKEVSLLLGTISGRFRISEEGGAAGSVCARQVAGVGRHFTRLLAHTQHRGAFEQAYVGFTRLLTRLWMSRSPSLHSLPRAWARQLTADVCSASGTSSATRRSAGLPFMIQALVTTELQAQGNPKCLHECMTTLLKLAGTTSLDTHKHLTQENTINSDITDSIETLSHSEIDSSLNDSENKEITKESLVEARTHSVNILRALFRNSALEESVSGYVEEGLMVALTGFDGDTWMERNSCTLLFSALMVRVFGVARRRGCEPAARNRMTGRIFFLRYPRLYDFILDKLRSGSSQPSLFPVLVLLGRLHPSSLEGTASALRLARLGPPLRACAGSRGARARDLAARALVPLVAPELYIPHLQSMLTIILDRSIKRNYCHGILLQLTRILDARPNDLTVDRDANERVVSSLKGSMWVLEQAVGERPCYIIADEYVKMVNLIIWRFPCFIDQDYLDTIKKYLEALLFAAPIPAITSGRDVCLANAMYLYFVILSKYGETTEICEHIYKGLEHKSYEVVLSTLNYLLILYDSLETDSCHFQSHLSTLGNVIVLTELRNSQKYVQTLCDVLKTNKYLECRQKTLKAMTLEKNTQKYIIGIKRGRDDEKIDDEDIVKELFDCIEHEHANLTHIYLKSLSNFVSEKLNSLRKLTILEVIRVIFAYGSSENSDSTREAVTAFLEANFKPLLHLHLEGSSGEDIFEYKATLWAAMAIILEDDNETIRQRISDTITGISDKPSRVVPSRGGEELRELVGGERNRDSRIALFVTLALLDYKSEVCMTDEISDECRVFDQNERYNIFLEESICTDYCAEEIIKICEELESNPLDHVQTLLSNHVYSKGFEKLCNNNLIIFKRMIKDKSIANCDVLNPKIELFVRKLSTI